MTRILAALGLLSGFGFLSTDAVAAWDCRNEAAEVSCGSGKCEIRQPQDFTPMSIEADAVGKLSVCAYSGCWEGEATTMLRQPPFLSFAGELPSAAGGEASVAHLTIDTANGTGAILFAGFVNPLICTERAD